MVRVSKIISTRGESFHRENFLEKYGIDFYNLRQAYDKNKCAYHNWNHIHAVLNFIENDKRFETLNHRNQLILVVTALYHDIVYNPKSNTNEEDSAEFINKLIIEDDTKEYIKDLILFTKYTRQPVGILEEIMLDADMDFFNWTYQEQIEVEKKVFKEYAWVPLKTYITERIKVLNKLKFAYNVKAETLIEYLERKEWNIGVLAGSFYPFTLGHLDILKQAEKIFDKVIILQSGRGESKTGFNWDVEKYGQLNQILDQYEVRELSNLITNDINELKKDFNVTLIRGLRNGSDLLYEQNYIQTVRDIDENVNSIYIMTKPEYAHISSSMVRELIKIDPNLAKKYIP